MARVEPQLFAAEVASRRVHGVKGKSNWRNPLDMSPGPARGGNKRPLRKTTLGNSSHSASTASSNYSATSVGHVAESVVEKVLLHLDESKNPLPPADISPLGSSLRKPSNDQETEKPCSPCQSVKIAELPSLSTLPALNKELPKLQSSAIPVRDTSFPPPPEDSPQASTTSSARNVKLSKGQERKNPDPESCLAEKNFPPLQDSQALTPSSTRKQVLNTPSSSLSNHADNPPSLQEAPFVTPSCVTKKKVLKSPKAKRPPSLSHIADSSHPPSHESSLALTPPSVSKKQVLTSPPAKKRSSSLIQNSNNSPSLQESPALTPSSVPKKKVLKSPKAVRSASLGHAGGNPPLLQESCDLMPASVPKKKGLKSPEAKRSASLSHLVDKTLPSLVVKSPGLTPSSAGKKSLSKNVEVRRSSLSIHQADNTESPPSATGTLPFTAAFEHLINKQSKTSDAEKYCSLSDHCAKSPASYACFPTSASEHSRKKMKSPNKKRAYSLSHASAAPKSTPPPASNASTMASCSEQKLNSPRGKKSSVGKVSKSKSQSRSTERCTADMEPLLRSTEAKALTIDASDTKRRSRSLEPKKMFHAGSASGNTSRNVKNRSLSTGKYTSVHDGSGIVTAKKRPSSKGVTAKKVQKKSASKKKSSKVRAEEAETKGTKKNSPTSGYNQDNCVEQNSQEESAKPKQNRLVCENDNWSLCSEPAIDSNVITITSLNDVEEMNTKRREEKDAQVESIPNTMEGRLYGGTSKLRQMLERADSDNWSHSSDPSGDSFGLDIVSQSDLPMKESSPKELEESSATQAERATPPSSSDGERRWSDFPADELFTSPDQQMETKSGVAEKASSSSSKTAMEQGSCAKPDLSLFEPFGGNHSPRSPTTVSSSMKLGDFLKQKESFDPFDDIKPKLSTDDSGDGFCRKSKGSIDDKSLDIDDVFFSADEGESFGVYASCDSKDGTTKYTCSSNDNTTDSEAFSTATPRRSRRSTVVNSAQHSKKKLIPLDWTAPVEANNHWSSHHRRSMDFFGDFQSDQNHLSSADLDFFGRGKSETNTSRLWQSAHIRTSFGKDLASPEVITDTHIYSSDDADEFAEDLFSDEEEEDINDELDPIRPEKESGGSDDNSVGSVWSVEQDEEFSMQGEIDLVDEPEHSDPFKILQMTPRTKKKVLLESRNLQALALD